MVRRRAGFTLVEVILALAIGTLLLLAVQAVLSSALATRDTLERQTAASRAAVAVVELLARDLRHATLRRGEEAAFLCDAASPGSDAPVVAGSAMQRLDFLTLAPPASAIEGVAATPTEVGYQLERLPGTDYWRLLRREQPYRDSQPTEGGALTTVLDGVGEWRLTFDTGEGTARTWNRKSLPRAVVVELSLWAGGPLPARRDATQELRLRRTITLPARGLVVDLSDEPGGDDAHNDDDPR